MANYHVLETLISSAILSTYERRSEFMPFQRVLVLSKCKQLWSEFEFVSPIQFYKPTVPCMKETKLIDIKMRLTQLAGVAENTDCISAER